MEYRQRLAKGALKPDSAQAVVAERLEELATQLQRAGPPGLLGKLLGAREKPPRGMYIHGSVGRGKTMLMDMFYADVECTTKKRIHFHAFMQDVHGRLHAARKANADALAPVAKAIAADVRLLCLDEMQVTDIADAMIIGRLFEKLLSHGAVIVTTSNLKPDELYRDGLNRQLFLPFVQLIKEKLDVVALDGGTDYRLGRVKSHETFLTPLGAASDAVVQDLWVRLTDTEKGEAVDIDVLGRKLHVPQAAHGCARFNFSELCERPLGPPDYLALAHNFGTVFVERIPVLKASQRNEAKRLVLLIDTLYDAGVRLVASSAKPPEGIYHSGDHRIEFERTVSRLREMQSASWWGKKIAET